MSVQVLIRMPKETKHRLQKEAQKRQLSLAALIRQIVLQYLRQTRSDHPSQFSS